MATVTIPHTFSPNTPAYSAQVNSNFASITAQVNGNLNEANIASGGITPSRVSNWPRAKAIYPGGFAQAPGGGTTIPLGTAEFDTDNMYDDVNDYFTIVTAGVYTVGAYVLQNALGACEMHIRRGPGGVFPTPGSANMVASFDARSGSVQHASCSGQDYFSAGDRIDMQWYNRSGGLVGLSLGFLMAVWHSP